MDLVHKFRAPDDFTAVEDSENPGSLMLKDNSK